MLVHTVDNPQFFRPTFTVRNHSGLVYQSKGHSHTSVTPEGTDMVLVCDEGVPLYGDTKFEFHFKGELVFYFWFNTSYLETGKFSLGRDDLDKFKTKRNFSRDFVVMLSLVEDDPSLSASRHVHATATEAINDQISLARDIGATAGGADSAEGNDELDSEAAAIAGIELAGDARRVITPPPTVDPGSDYDSDGEDEAVLANE